MSSKPILSLALAALAGAVLLLAGCGTPGAPQPPSLNLPQRVTDLSAVRAGHQVSLTWTMPKRSTDKLLLNDKIAVPVKICRQEASGKCEPVDAELAYAPGADGSFTDTLPASLVAGPPRPLSYFIGLKNRNGRSAGLSNGAPVLAGLAPAPVTGLSAEVRKQGVVLHWAAIGGAPETSVIRLRRKLLNPPAAKPQGGPLVPQPEPVDQNLLVDSCAPDGATGLCRAIDKNIRFGQSYEYRAQRVARVAMGGKTVELAGELSAPLRVEVLDVFPPEVPTGLAAVATIGDNSGAVASQTAIDLSWQPVAESDLAGYVVYRRETGSDWQRISPAGPIVPPAFHDANVQSGHTYHYAVSAIDQGGHESARSIETEETVPNS
ncbi:MAG: fibronectin type III domain-containing protein [Terracidiphilus sp.]|jgi:hypothetical protein